MADFNATFDDLLAGCERSAVHLEMRDGYALDDPVFIDWRAGQSIDPAERWPNWFKLIKATAARGIEVRRARIVSEPVSEYIRYEYDVTAGLNIAAGEQVRRILESIPGASDVTRLIEEQSTDPETGAILYRTTDYFLERLGLASLADLPELAPFLPDEVEDEQVADDGP